MNQFPHLFSPLRVGGLELANRITMAPLFMGYAEPGGEVGRRSLAHYQEMGASGAALVVVESALVDVRGQGGPNTLRADDDRFLEGLSRLAEAIKAGGALAALQLNHPGRYAMVDDPV
ncbi:MAG: NADH:flavin oxidoreductase, partial [Proteobacteria bacterium]|nr:NADH:flavin oxidoreductase [Pseudomonadota bacterium]MBU1740830.1 NADH:flavin oxidoreductase [Pseudomonadota bacterium]